MARATRRNSRIGSAEIAAQAATFGLVGAANLGVQLTLKTDAQRLACTPGLGESVYATDTHLFWVGDGTTAGGIVSDCGFSAQQLIRLGIIRPRHTQFMPLLRAAVAANDVLKIPKFAAVGNSITAGDGATASLNWVTDINTLLVAYTGIGTTHWMPSKYAVSGATISTMLALLADCQDPAAYLYPKRSTLWATGPKLVTLMEMRNSPLYMGVEDYALQLRLALLQIKKHGADPVFFTENVQINPATGIPLDGATWQTYYQTGLQVAANEGASLVDVWGYYNLLYRLGVDLRPLISGDGEHPNNRGYELFAALLFRCLTTPAVAAPGGFTDRPVTDGRVAVVANYTDFAGQVVPTVIGTGGTTGVLAQLTSRAYQLGELSAAATAYVCSAGKQLWFRAPGPIKGVIVSFLCDSHNTGRPSLLYNIAPAGAAPAGARWDGYEADGVTTLRMMSYVTTRQFDWFYSTQGMNATYIDGTVGDLKITANGGQITVLGVTWITEGGQSHSIWPDLTSVGAWANGTFPGGEPCRTTTQDLDAETINFFGTSIGFFYEVGPDRGKFTVAIDGGAPSAAQDCYSTGPQLSGLALGATVKNLPLGWHTATITGAGKNAASSGNVLKYGRVSVGRGTPDASVTYLPLAVGEVYQLGEVWKYAAIDRVISGTPVVKFTPGASSITLGASGAAVVRLTR